MNSTTSAEAPIKDNFAVAQVALYLFAILQFVVAPMTATGAIPLGMAPQAPTRQRVSTTVSAVVNILCFTVGYVLLAQCLNRCTTLVWRIALSTFLLNAGVAVLAIAAQPNLYPVLTCGLSVAGALSVWRGRGAIRDYMASKSSDRSLQPPVASRRNDTNKATYRQERSQVHAGADQSDQRRIRD